MKKSLLILIALMLCASIFFTGCEYVSNFINPDNDSDNVVNNDPQPPKNVNKTTVIQNFNKIDLLAMYDTINGTIDDVVNSDEFADFDPYAVNQQISGRIKVNKSSADFLAALDSGVVHVVLADPTPGSTDKEEVYLYITDTLETITFYLDENGKWSPEGVSAPDVPVVEDTLVPTGYSATREEVDYFEQLFGVDSEMIKYILEEITIPAVAEDQLTLKDGKLVLAESYYVDLLVENFDLLLEIVGSEGAPTKEEFEAELNESIGTLGLEIAFNANDNAITAVYVTLTPEESETTLSFEAQFSDNGKAVKSIKASILSCDEDVDYNTGFVVTITNTLDGDVITGTKMVAEIYNMNMDYNGSSMTDSSTGSTSYYTYICSKYVIDVSITDVVEGKDPVLSAVLSQSVEKVYDVESYYDYNTYETTETVKEISKDEYDSNFFIKLDIVSDLDAEKCDVTLEYSMDEVELEGKFTWLLTAAPDFTEIPAEITEYINNYNAQ